MKIKRLFLLGITSTLIFLCLYAPAQLLGSLLAQFSSGRLGLANSQGSLWQGEASLLLNSIDDNAAPLNLGKISWNTQPLQLLIGRFSINITLNDSAPFWITLDSSRLHVEHASLTLPSEMVASLVPTLKAAQLGGQLVVRCESLSITHSEILGKLDVNWNLASSPLSMVNPLGNYHYRLEGSGSALKIKLETQGESALIMHGNGSWTSKEGLHFDGIAKAKATAKTQLQMLLHVMGNEMQADSGRYQLRL